MLSGSFVPVFAGNNIVKLDSVQSPPSQVLAINLIINNDDTFISFQVDIPLPEGFTYVSGSAQLNPARVTDHIINSNVITGNVLRIFSISFSNSPFLGNSGPVASFQLNASAIPGQYPLPFSNYIIGDISGTNIATGAVAGAVNVLGPLTVQVSADPDEICAGEAVQLSSTITGGGWSHTLLWSSIPPGFSSSDPSPVVFPIEDTEYILTVDDGNQVVNASAFVAVGQMPTASAGNNFSVCIGNNANLTGSATNFTSVVWQGGSGTFTNPNSLVTQYIPHPDDYVNSPIMLTLTANGSPFCPPAVSNVSVAFVQPPQAYAGPDKFVHAGNPHQISGATAQNFAGIVWQTAGDGVFNNSLILNPIYTPGSQDIANGSVVLTLTASPQSPCSAAADNMRLYVLSGNDNTMVMHGGSAAIDDTITVRLAINNKHAFTAFSCLVTFPEQMSYLDGTATFTGRETDHQLDLVSQDNTLLFDAVSPSNANFTGGFGYVLQFDLLTGGIEGQFPVLLSFAEILEPQDHFNILTATVNGQILITITAIPERESGNSTDIKPVITDGSGTIGFLIKLPEGANVHFHVYDMMGRKVQDTYRTQLGPGTHIIEFNQIKSKKTLGQPGLYLVRIEVDDIYQTTSVFKVISP